MCGFKNAYVAFPCIIGFFLGIEVGTNLYSTIYNWFCVVYLILTGKTELVRVKPWVYKS